ncbi:MAG: hypothetical protein ACP5VF_13950, partial [Acidobacteriota bacterium]
LTFTDDPSLLRGSDFAFITVGTPSREDGSIDLRYVRSAARTAGENLSEGKREIIVVKSTVVPGTTMGAVREEVEAGSGRKFPSFGLASNPEFLKEGSAVQDTFHPDRLVIGESDKEAGEALLSLYEAFFGASGEGGKEGEGKGAGTGTGKEGKGTEDKPLPPLVRTTPENAEMIKYANNCFLAMKVSFAN